MKLIKINKLIWILNYPQIILINVQIWCKYFHVATNDHNLKIFTGTNKQCAT